MTSDWGYSGFVPALNGPESPQDREIRVDHSHGYSGGDSSRLDVQGAPPMSRRVPEDQTRPTALSNVYSFVPIPGATQHKRPRRRYEDIERKYKCGWNGCEKAYGTLNHLNVHVTMQAHGEKRTPEEFRKSVKLDASATKPAQSIDAPKNQQAEASDVNEARENCDSNPPCNTLYVGNLPTQTSEDELKAIFSKQQGYKRMCFRTRQNGPLCLVEFEDVAFATYALNNLDGYLLHGSTTSGILLSFSKNPLGVPSSRVGRSPGGPGPRNEGTTAPRISAQLQPKAERKAAGSVISAEEHDRPSDLGYRTAPDVTLPKLPPGWIAQWDILSKKYYYVHISTGMSQWDLPTGEASDRNSRDGQSLNLGTKRDTLSKLQNATVAADEPTYDPGLAFIVGSKPTDFKSKNVMSRARKRALDSFLKRQKRSDKSSSSQAQEATSTTSTAAASKQTPNSGSRRPRRFHDEPQSPVKDTDVEVSELKDLNRDANRFSRDYQFNVGATGKEMHGKAVALFDFEPENNNELSLIEGQIVMVLYRKGQGWLVAQDLKTGESGLVPEEYVRILRGVEGGQPIPRPFTSVLYSVPPHNAAQFGSEEYVDGSKKHNSGTFPLSPGQKGDLYNMATQKSRSKAELESVKKDLERLSARLLSPALSSPEVSPVGYASTVQESEVDDESEGEIEELSQDERSQEKLRPARRVKTALFVLEQLDSDETGYSDLEVVRPDHFEDAASDNNSSVSKDVFHQRFEELHLKLVEYSSDDEEQERRCGQKKKRWSAGVFKRSHSYSELDSSSSDSDPLYETDPKARRLRLRRRLLGIIESSPTDKSNARSNSELHSPVADGCLDGKGPPSIPSGDGYTLDEPRYFQDEDFMDVETARLVPSSHVGQCHPHDPLRQQIQVTQEEVTHSHGNPEGDNREPLPSESLRETLDVRDAEPHKETRSPITTFQYDPVPLANKRESDAVKDLAERRRIQNRIAQRNYRKNLKQRLEALENRVRGREAGRSEGTHPNDPDNGPDEAGIDPEVFAYQDFGEEVIINCVCGVADDRRFIIPCVACGKWQHIACYYDLAGDVEESHQCVQCVPRGVNRGGNSSSKQSVMPDENPFHFPVSMEIDAKNETTGTETSIGPNKGFSGVAYTYPTSVSTNFVFGGVPKRASDEDVESSYRMSWVYPTTPPFKQGSDGIDNPKPMSLTLTHTVKKQTSDPETTMKDIEYGSPMASIAMTNDNGTFFAQGEDQVAETWYAHPDQPSGESDKNGDEYQLIDRARDAHLFDEFAGSLEADWNVAQMLLPESWRWDVEFQFGCWTATPIEADGSQHYPLTIARAPVVLPVDYQWPPIGGVNPPPDPRPSAPINCQAPLAVEIIRDLFLTFEGSVGFYILISGLLQIIVPRDFDTAWASSHLPHKYGGLKVCYIEETLEATMLPSATETTKARPPLLSPNSSLSGIFRSSRTSTAATGPTLKLNDFIEARPKANHRKEKYAGRLGLKVTKDSEPYLLMSTHVITEAMLVKSHREAIFGRNRDRFEKLGDDWNKSVEIWAGNEVIGTIDKSFDTDADVYPNGFHHDVTLIKPTSPASIKDVVSPIANLGWLNHESWASLRQNTSAIKILGCTESHRCAKSIKCSRPSEILVVGEGIFLNQTAAAGNSRSLKDHDMSTWKNLVSRALLYRVSPDFDPPNGYSGIALYADGVRCDGSEGPGVVGFQSFVQRSGHVQSFNMDGPALERRLQLGRVAFYGAFEVPEELKRQYDIV